MPAMATVADSQYPAHCCNEKETCCQSPLAVTPSATLAELYSEFVTRGRMTHGSDERFSKACIAFAQSCRQLASVQSQAWSKEPCLSVAQNAALLQPLQCPQRPSEATARGRDLKPARHRPSTGGGGDKEIRLVQELHGMLSLMSPETRRPVIKERLSQIQRRKLEAFLLDRKASEATQIASQQSLMLAGRPLDTHYSQRSLCMSRSRTGRWLCRPSLHIQAGLYACCTQLLEYEEAISALGVMIAIRSLCCSGADDFQERVTKACSDALLLCEPGTLRLSFRCRVQIMQCELTTPARPSIAPALQDWCCLQVFVAGQKQALRIQEEDIPTWLSVQLAASQAANAHLFAQWRKQLAEAPSAGAPKRLRAGPSRDCEGHPACRLDTLISQWSRLLLRSGSKKNVGKRRLKVAVMQA
mmetsp:Transcript_16274/g.36515  ORF Transcript_16274/g.36515 Transcript_16274/m.36515 type:complete len:415 (-) Transcript_16274:73-1317(-)